MRTFRDGSSIGTSEEEEGRTGSVVPGSTTIYSHAKMKKHFSSPSPCCSVHALHERRGIAPSLCFPPQFEKVENLLVSYSLWETAAWVEPCLKKRLIMFALLGSAMHNRVCIAVSNCNPTPSVPSTCSTASLQGVCSSGGV